MSFRTEEKLLINKLQLTEFKEFLFKKKASKKFPSRKIQSLYFENFSEDMYSDSIEGIVPRKKIRVRNYLNNENLNLYLEMKVSSVEGRYKTRTIIDKKKFEDIKRLGIYDSQYGTCRPLIYVTYIRDYFQLNDVRISIDENIYYNLFSGRKLGYDINSIVELKSSANKDKDDLLNTFPFQRTRFSKYCNGFEKI
tara:strand:- start:124 stop:708 length:585 start_codon:yes stop_codon:yes gene_type:complete